MENEKYEGVCHAILGTAIVINYQGEREIQIQQA